LTNTAQLDIFNDFNPTILVKSITPSSAYLVQTKFVIHFLEKEISDGILSPEALLQVFKSAEALHILGGRLNVFVAVTLLNIIDGLLAH